MSNAKRPTRPKKWVERAIRLTIWSDPDYRENIADLRKEYRKVLVAGGQETPRTRSAADWYAAKTAGLHLLDFGRRVGSVVLKALRIARLLRIIFGDW